jgi:hypothetical protein
MIITRKSVLSGILRSMDLPITQGQIDRWRNGGLIQLVMPNLSDDEREFFMTGISPEEWDEAFGDHTGSNGQENGD